MRERGERERERERERARERERQRKRERERERESDRERERESERERARGRRGREEEKRSKRAKEEYSGLVLRVWRLVLPQVGVKGAYYRMTRGRPSGDSTRGNFRSAQFRITQELQSRLENFV